MSTRLICGDCLKVLRTLPDCSVQMCVTSPPYFGLRDYGCAGQIGLEPTPEEYVAKLVAAFREVRRVLRDDGTLWLNLGDSYASSTKGSGGGAESSGLRRDGREERSRVQSASLSIEPQRYEIRKYELTGLKPKDLIGIPWLVAFALRADGWYLRQDIIWHKPNPMPESVRDRCTKAHEYIFLFAKGQWKTRVIQLADLQDEIIHLRKDGVLCAPDSGTGTLSVGLASAIFDSAQRESEFSLPPLYSEVWEQGANGGDSLLVGGVPVVHGASILAARFLRAGGSAKQFLCEIHRILAVLPDRDDLLKRWVPSILATPPSVYRYGDGTVAVNHSGQICKLDVCHGSIITHSSTECKYYYDAEAVKEPSVDPQGSAARYKYEFSGRDGLIMPDGKPQGIAPKGMRVFTPTRNRRDVWTVATKPYAGAHFATFPPKLIEPCILAGTPTGGSCPRCGAPWERVTKRIASTRTLPDNGKRVDERKADGTNKRAGEVISETLGWSATCSCDAGNPIPATVLDPFAGSGTVGMVCAQQGRSFIGIELNPAYIELAEARIAAVQPRLDLEDRPHE